MPDDPQATAAASPLRRIVDQASTLVGFVALLALLAVAYRLSAVPVTLDIDGQVRTVRTHAGTVGDLLIELAVPIERGDLVEPPRARRLGRGERVVVRRARPVRVVADGRVTLLRSHGRSALAVLTEAGVQLGPGDAVHVNGQPWPVDQAVDAPRPVALASAGGGSVAPDTPPERAVAQTDPDDAAPAPDLSQAESWTVEVLRAVPMTVVEHDLPFEITVAGSTVEGALASAGIPLHPEDRVHPPRLTPLMGGMHVAVVRAVPFEVEVDGSLAATRAVADSVGEALAATGFPLRGRDYAIPSADRPLEPGMHIQVVRVVEDILVREVEIPYRTVTEPDPELPLDETRVLLPGEPGLKTQRVIITYENGVELSRHIAEETVTREPVAQQLAYGTKIVWHTVDTPAGPLRYWRQLRLYATSYSASRAGTPTHVPWYGITRMGIPMRHGIVAVDPRIVSLGTNVYVPVYGPGLAADTGGGIKGYRIDLGYDDDNYQGWHWWVDVYLLEPLPPAEDIRWLLP